MDLKKGDRVKVKDGYKSYPSSRKVTGLVARVMQFAGRCRGGQNCRWNCAGRAYWVRTDKHEKIYRREKNHVRGCRYQPAWNAYAARVCEKHLEKL